MSETKNDNIHKIMTFLKKHTNNPEIGIVCGSGLGGLTKQVSNAVVLKYEDIPGFPRSTVHGHAGELVFGNLGGKRVVCMRGRFHVYEGYNPATTAVGIRVFAGLGARAVIVTNAAGGVNSSFNVGDLMIIEDHISIPGMAGFNPLSGPNDPRFGPRFPAMNGAYTPELIALTRKVASGMKEQPILRQGAYCYVNGPSYETPTEVSYLRSLGGGSVGMSTVNEIITARHCGLQILGLSLITNKGIGVGDKGDPPTHAEVISAINKVQTQVEELVKRIVAAMDVSGVPLTPGGEYFAKALRSSM